MSVRENCFGELLILVNLSLRISGADVNALDFVRDTKERLISFLHDFLLLCDFTPARRPNTYLRCDDCGYRFATRPKSGVHAGRIRTASTLQVEVKDRPRSYGVIICPKCGGETDTELDFWRREGIVLSDKASPSDVMS
jgi:predicted RNA-binding Zn-ribbon protein involved in translation (DUF1610 family)